ncbi:Hypothetical predicted protein [Podarcis lilfordi]|uniref:Uncharacterized protein n=1 Tax=Podarcis lilfordi TaxID=74358 RepID=A0AA35W1X9_9SAUR|nr:Hypothetical predicted protein [Podarcis lilfordi]
MHPQSHRASTTAAQYAEGGDDEEKTLPLETQDKIFCIEYASCRLASIVFSAYPGVNRQDRATTIYRGSLPTPPRWPPRADHEAPTKMAPAQENKYRLPHSKWRPRPRRTTWCAGMAYEWL